MLFMQTFSEWLVDALQERDVILSEAGTGRYRPGAS